MTDDELAEWFGLNGVVERDRIIAALTPEQRAKFELIRAKEVEILSWLSGATPRPVGVIVCRGSHKRGRRQAPG